MRIWIALFCFWMVAGYSDANAIYTVGGDTNDVYIVDVINGSHSVVASSLEGIPEFIALANDQTAYVVSESTEVQRVDLINGIVSTVANFSGGSVTNGIALVNPSVAYVLNKVDLVSGVYRVDLTNGSSSLVFSSVMGQANGLALEFSLKEPKVAYTVGSADGSVYRIDLTNSSASVVTPSPVTGAQLCDLALANNTTAYAVGFVNSNIYHIDLIDGGISLVSTIEESDLSGIGLTNSTTAYVVDSSGDNVFCVDLTDGSYFKVTQMNIPGSALSGVAPVLQIGTTGLRGNNLTLANYLNENGSPFVLRLFALQSDIAQALKIATPTRNAIATFTAQTNQLAFGQALSNHLCQKRLATQVNEVLEQEVPMVQPPDQVDTNARGLISDASVAVNVVQMESTPATCQQERPFSTWLGLFGEYTHEKSESQIPAFSSGTGDLSPDSIGKDASGRSLYWELDWLMDTRT